MRIAFDENLSHRLFIYIPDILGKTNLEIINIKDRYGKGKQDIHWFKAYAEDDGKFFLSNDHAMRRKKAEFEAYKKAQLKGIFMPKNWSELAFHQRAALILLKWPAIEDRFQKMKQGDMFMLTYNWSDSSNSFKQM